MNAATQTAMTVDKGIAESAPETAVLPVGVREEEEVVIVEVTRRLDPAKSSVIAGLEPVLVPTIRPVADGSVAVWRPPIPLPEGIDETLGSGSRFIRWGCIVAGLGEILRIHKERQGWDKKVDSRWTAEALRGYTARGYK